MTWLDTKIRSDEIDVSLSSNELNDVIGDIDVEDLSLDNDKFFEFDDNTSGVDIDGYLFFPKKVDGDESFSHREFIRTKIMGGGEFVTRGQYIPKEFSFDTIIDIVPEDLDKYVDIFSTMENKVCTITSPYMGGMFKGEVNINVTNPESSPHVIECKVKIKEIPSAMATLKGDPVIQYPSINTISDVTVKEKQATESQPTKKQRYDAYNSSQSRNF